VLNVAYRRERDPDVTVVASDGTLMDGLHYQRLKIQKTPREDEMKRSRLLLEIREEEGNTREEDKTLDSYDIQIDMCSHDSDTKLIDIQRLGQTDTVIASCSNDVHEKAWTGANTELK